MRPRLSTTLAAGSLAAFATMAAADVHLHYRDANGQPAADVYVHDGRVRMERRDDDVAMLVDTRSGSMTLIDHGRRMYSIMDADTMSRMRAQMAQMRAQMQQQLAALPEQQRKLVEQQMGGMMGAEQAGPEFRRTDERRVVDGRECAVVEGSLASRALFSACVAPAATLNLPPEDAATLEAFAKTMAEHAGSMQGAAKPGPLALEGVPLQSTDALTGRVETLSAVATGQVDAALFEVPAEYVEQRMGGPGMGMPMAQ